MLLTVIAINFFFGRYPESMKRRKISVTMAKLLFILSCCRLCRNIVNIDVLVERTLLGGMMNDYLSRLHQLRYLM